uniref:Uncharacterized protein n=1 Tax=Magallana gigas TaxID=29159 RepID=K1QBS8_MAGGI
MKERYLADAKLKRRLPGESLRDFGQAIKDIYRRAYCGNPDIVDAKEQSEQSSNGETFRSILDKPQLKPVSTMYVVADGRKLDCAGEAIMVLTFGEIVYEHPVIQYPQRGKTPLVAGEGAGPACVDSLETTLSQQVANPSSFWTTEPECSQMLTVSQTTTISTTTGGQDMTSTAYTTLSTNEQTTRTEASVTGVSQTTTIFTATGAQDMTSTAYTTLSTNEQTTRTEASVTGATTGGEDMTSTAYTTTSTNEQTTRSETSSTDAMCPCQCEYFDKIEYWAQESNQRKQYEELSKKLAEIKDILKMETKNLSSFINKKISAADDRPSAVATGFLGAGIITIVLAGIVLLDLPVIIQQARHVQGKKRMCQQFNRYYQSIGSEVKDVNRLMQLQHPGLRRTTEIPITLGRLEVHW